LVVVECHRGIVEETHRAAIKARVAMVGPPITSVQSHVTLRLIQQGTKCVSRADEVMEVFQQVALVQTVARGETGGGQESAVSGKERAVLVHIHNEPVHDSTIMERLNGMLPVERDPSGDAHA
jgi:predicted Rossmann fold nucleotide-binding protein DprA/Smf involved in DNA uptake